jgi:hypothetical protein
MMDCLVRLSGAVDMVLTALLDLYKANMAMMKVVKTTFPPLRHLDEKRIA